MQQCVFPSNRCCLRAITFILFQCWVISAFATTYYVKPAGSNNNNGTSWATAFQTLQKALQSAGSGDQIWVAAGTYYPGSTYSSFNMKNGVAIYGGFATSGNPGFASRNWNTNPTILNGEAGDPNQPHDNSTVISNSGLDHTAVLDGFIITNGNGGDGGGMYNNDASPTINNCTFSGNRATNGAGLCNLNAAPVLTNCVFSGNIGTEGGALGNYNSSATLINCTITGNFATAYGAIYTESGGITLINSIVWGNGNLLGPAIYGPATFTYSIVQGGATGTGNLDADPLLSNNRPQACSPAINAGDDTAVPAGISTDLDNNVRFYNYVDIGAYEYQGNNPAPVASCKNITVYVNASGTATVNAAAINNGSTGCAPLSYLIDGGASLALSCSNIGTPKNVILKVIDASLNTSTCTATITVADNIAPTVVCQNATVNLSASGTGSITTAAVFQSGSDNCGTVNQVSVSPSTFTCSNLGSNLVTLTANDGHGNTSTCTATVTVVDAIAPTVACKPATVNLNASGNGSITTIAVLQNAADNCGSGQVSANPISFNCSNLGLNTVTLTANDGHGNTSTCTATVTVVDNIAPSIVCKNVTVNLNASGAGNIATAAVFQSGTDNCGIVNQVSVLPNTFTCANVGANTVTLTANDGHGNTGTCTATITVVDNTSPIALCQNVTVQLNAAGTGSTTAAAINNNSSDACGIGSLSLSQTTFTCANLGTNAVTLTATDNNGNTGTCTATVTVVDNIAPSIVCKNATVNLNASGAGNVNIAAVFQGGDDNCGSLTASIPPSTFNCTNLGAHIITLTADDGHGNTSTCTATVTVNDNIVPTVVCRNTTVNLSALGAANVTADAVFQSGTDNCGMVNPVSVSPATFTCSDIGANVVTLTANDGHGNTGTCTATVTVVDNIAPTVVCKPATINLNASGIGIVFLADVFQSNTDNCAVNQTLVSPGSFGCNSVGLNIVTLTVDDGHGNTGTCAATVTVVDNIAPTVVCKNATVNLGTSGTGNVTPSAVFQGGIDNCGTVNPVSVLPSTFTCANVGTNTVTLTANDGHGNTSTCTATVTVVDNTSPIAVCQNVTVQLNTAGTGNTTAAAINNSSSDACGIASLNVSQSTFTCANLGANIVTLTATDNNSNSSTCTATVTVVDNIAPSVVCKNATVNLNASGATSITTAAVFQSGADNCGTVNQVSVSPNAFTCSNVGANVVTLTANDGHSNTGTCTATVTVVDNTSPVANCKIVLIQLDATGTASTTAAALNDNSSDACGIASLNATQTTFTCANQGPNAVILTATDNYGNTSTCIATVIVRDYLAPSVVCKNTTVNLNATGSASLGTAAVFQSGTDNCGTVNPVSVSPNAFTCANVGTNIVTLTASDGYASTATCTATVTVVDNTAPIAACQNVTVQLNAAGTGSTTAAAINNNSSDVCGLSSLVLSQTAFTCTNLGANTVTLTATDNNGNSSTCTGTVTVVDNIVPNVTCKNATVNLNTSGTGNIAATAVFQSGTDNCGTVNQVSVLPNAFTCANVGANTVTLTANDGHGNTSTCTATVTVVDNTSPVAVCQNVTVQLNAAGTGNTTAAAINNSSSDACGIASLNVSQTAFTCANLGANTVNLTATDNNGNSSACTATVTVVDNIAPSVVCKNATVNLNASGAGNIAATAVFQSGTDNCGTVNQVSVLPNTFTCANVGTNMVTLTANDGHGNTSTCTATITVVDNTNPIAVCQNVTAQLNAAGAASTTVAAINNNSSDACGIASLVLSQTAFTCNSLGANTVTLTATDNNGNSSTCTATVTVVDNIAPSVVCKNATVNLNAVGAASITTAAVFQSSTDNCGTVNQVSVLPNAFTCANVGANTVTLTANDGHGNTSTCTATITVVDNTNPIAVCQNVTAQLNAAGAASTTVAAINNNSSDACGLASLVLSQTAFTCTNLGANIVILTATDNNSNSSTCTATVTVVDNIVPSVVCQNATVNLNAVGTASITTAAVFQSGADNCGIINQVSVLPNTFTCSNLGANVVTLNVNDGHGNTATCTATVTVNDNIAPTVACQNTTVNLSAAGTGSITTAAVFQSSADNCGIVNQVSVLPNTFTCSNLGTNVVILNVNDGHGNTATCTATVTVNDNIAPTVACQNATVNLSAAGTGSITTAAVFQSSADNCGIINQVSVLPNTFTCSNLGANVVILNVNDGHGNTATCTATVTVNDNIAPTVACQNTTVNLSAAGTGSITTTSVFQSSADNCGIVNQVSVLPNTFTCGNLGTNVVTLNVNDGHGNTATCTATVTVNDNIAPTVACQNTTVNLSAAGTGSITTAAVFQSSADNCGIVNQVSVLPNTFTCSNLGANVVILNVNDGHGNTATCTATVTVNDNIAPTVACQNTTVNLSAAGTGSITTTAVFQSSADNCGIVNQVSVLPNTFTCSNLGANVVTLNVNDGHGNTATCTATVTVNDNIAPTVACQNTTVNLSAAGTGSITTAAVFQSSADNCGIVNQVSVLPNTFTCSNLGANVVTLVVNDGHGNTATCSATVTVNDNIAPTVACQNTTVNLSAAGTGSITTAAVFQSSADNCGIVNQVSVLPNTFTCSNLGANVVTLNVNDGHGNTATCSATVTVVDNLAPTVVCQNTTVNLSAAGTGSITTAAVFQSGADNCGIVNQVSVLPNTFTCSNLGANAVTLVVNDGHGNTATCSATVTVVDNLAPTVVCKNAILNLSSSGFATLNPADVFQSGADNCGIVNLVSVAPNAFTCSTIGNYATTLLVNDGHGNTASCNAVVTVRDVTLPTALCKPVTVFLNAAGTVTVAPAQVNNGSSDGCGIATLVVTPSTFSCTNIGNNMVTLKVTDLGNNMTSCNATVTVKDNLGPNALCKDITVNLNDEGKANITPASVNNGTNDPCGVANLSINVSSFACIDINSPKTVVLTARDINGNTSSCLAYVTVKDVIAPTAVCENITVALNAQGKATVNAASLTLNSFDNCSVWSYTPTTKVYTSANLGLNYLSILVKDFSGNGSTCVAQVTVVPYGSNTNLTQSGHQNRNVAPTTSTAEALSLTVFPNPTEQDVTVVFQLPKEQAVDLRMFDLNGRLVLHQEVNGVPGENVWPLELGDQPAGVYLLQIQSDTQKAQQRLVIQRN